MSYIMEVKEISKKYGKKQVLDSVSINVSKGECVGIIGVNGCGKSTLLSILSGSMKADKGKVFINGIDTGKKSGIFDEVIGYVPQENPLMLKLTVLDNLKFWYCDSARNLNDDLTNGIISYFGLNEYIYTRADKLSGGMKKRLSIVCALAKNPEILILDEPGAALDIVCKSDIKKYLKDYMRNGGTVIITSHEEGELSLCDRMYLLKDGKASEPGEKYEKIFNVF